MSILAEKGHFLCYKGLRLGLIDRMQQIIARHPQGKMVV